MEYEKRIIAFIDILGFKVAVEESEGNEEGFANILETLTTLKNFFIQQTVPDELQKITNAEYNIDTRTIQISDSLIISRLINESGGVYRMLTDCAHATHLLINQGFLL